ncbi:MAG: hypothetical protein ACXWKM_12215 [Phenylobacterium sp.]
MSVSATSTSTTAMQPPPPNSALRAAFEQLTSAINSGDLESAKKAYASLQKTSGSSDAKGPMADLMASIGDALNSGKIDDAKSALAAFQQAHPRPGQARSGTNDESASSKLQTLVTSSSNQIDVSV